MTIAFPSLRRAAGPPEVPAPDAEPAVQAPQEAPAPQPAGHALTRPDGGRVGIPAQCLNAIRHAIAQGRRRAGTEGNWVSGFLAAKPRSVDEQRSYLANRRWLPPGHEGGIADRAGEAYQVAYGIPGVAFGNAIGLTFKHGFRFTVAVLIVLVSLFAVCRFVLWLPPATCVLVPGMLAAILAGWLALVAGVLAGRRAFAAWRTGRT